MLASWSYLRITNTARSPSVPLPARTDRQTVVTTTQRSGASLPMPRSTETLPGGGAGFGCIVHYESGNSKAAAKLKLVDNSGLSLYPKWPCSYDVLGVRAESGGYFLVADLRSLLRHQGVTDAWLPRLVSRRGCLHSEILSRYACAWRAPYPRKHLFTTDRVTHD